MRRVRSFPVMQPEAPLPPYIPGSSDNRTYEVEGRSFRVWRGPDPRALGFGWQGGGRDGDVVLPDATEPAILERILAGIADLPLRRGTEHPVADPTLLAQIERAMLRAAGRPPAIERGSNGSRSVAEALLALPLPPGATRTWQLHGEHQLHVRVGPDGDAIAYAWKWGSDPGDWLPRTLRALGVAPERVGGSEMGQRYRVPAAVLGAFAARALDHLGARDLRVHDAV